MMMEYFLFIAVEINELLLTYGLYRDISVYSTIMPCYVRWHKLITYTIATSVYLFVESRNCALHYGIYLNKSLPSQPHVNT